MHSNGFLLFVLFVLFDLSPVTTNSAKLNWDILADINSSKLEPPSNWVIFGHESIKSLHDQIDILKPVMVPIKHVVYQYSILKLCNTRLR